MNGLVVLDKPAGVTSHRVLEPVKRALGRGVKVGHAGTLDAFATGVLLSLVGHGTRLFDVVATLPKSYDATVLFGEETETLDPEGAVIRRADPGAAPPAGLSEALVSLTGEISQRPPVYSALKVDGRRASDRARQGDVPVLAPRTVTIHELSILEEAWPLVRLRVVCGSGTYVRSVARDIGEAIGLPSRLDALRRTAIGPFRAEEGLAPGPEGEIDPTDLAERLVSPAEAFLATTLPRIELPAEGAVEFRHGRSWPTDMDPSALVGVLTPGGGRLLGLARIDEAGLLRPSRVFAVGADTTP